MTLGIVTVPSNYVNLIFFTSVLWWFLAEAIHDFMTVQTVLLYWAI